MPRHIVSVDLGQSIDPTAIAVLEVTTRAEALEARYDDPPGPPVPKDWFGQTGGLKHPERVCRVDVRHLERLPLRMPALITARQATRLKHGNGQVPFPCLRAVEALRFLNSNRPEPADGVD